MVFHDSDWRRQNVSDLELIQAFFYSPLVEVAVEVRWLGCAALRHHLRATQQWVLSRESRCSTRAADRTHHKPT